MKTREQDFYYGCVLSKIINFTALTTFKKIEGQQGIYTINDEKILLIKYSTETGIQWQFSLSKSEIKQFKEDDLLMPMYIAFVCSNQYICLLNRDDLLELLGNTHSIQTFVISLDSMHHFHIRNRDLDLFKLKPINEFPSSLFDSYADKDDIFRWPHLCTINVYRENPIKIFSSNDLRFDLSDLLTQNLADNEVRVSYVGVSTKNPTWETWDESTKRKIEERIVYLFEFEGVEVEIEPVTNKCDTWCTDEFIWQIKFWREPDLSDEFLLEAREIVLDFQKASSALLERHLDITYYQASCLMSELESEGIVSPIRSDGSREMLMSEDYSGISGFLFLDDVRTPPVGAILCRDADQAIKLIETGTITVISFNHDLDSTKTGYDVAKRIEELVKQGRIPLPKWHIHSASPIDRKNIKAVMDSAERYTKQKK